MIRKLRMRLILLTMLAVLLVMVILIGGINVSNYRQVVSESDDILEILMRNGGAFDEHGPGKGPKEGMPPKPGMSSDDTLSDFETTIIVDDDARSGKRSFMWLREDRIDSPELAYETRYFTVLFDESENAVLVDTGRISAVSESLAISSMRRARTSTTCATTTTAISARISTPTGTTGVCAGTLSTRATSMSPTA